jgi:uncharacterized protein (DUF1330 family)
LSIRNSARVALALAAGFGLGALTLYGLRAQAKPPIYYISEIDVTDVDAYMKEFVPKVRATVTAAGGRTLAASTKVPPIEGEPPKSRATIGQWESLEKLQAWRNSAEYKEARKLGDKYAKFRTFVVDGVPQ